MRSLPPGTQRLLPSGVNLSTSPSEVIARLLEDGDANDLRWLVRELGAAALRTWVLEQGDRRLSTRSLAFWRCVLALEAGPTDPLAAALWPAYTSPSS